MSNVCKIVIVDDHELFRVALRNTLQLEPDIETVAELENARDIIQTIKDTSPQLVLMDLMLPGIGGIDSIREIRRRFPGVKVLVVTVHSTMEYVIASFDAGALGYVLKDSTADELRFAVRTALSGKRYVSSGIVGNVVAAYRAGGARIAAESPWSRVTRRERQVLKLIAEGKSTKSIAEYLCISAKTVKTHRSHLMAKLKLHNAAELTAYAIVNQLVVPKRSNGDN